MLQKIVERVKLRVIIKFLGPIAKDDMVVKVTNGEELKNVIKENIDEKWFSTIAIALNDKIVSNLDEIKDGDVISLLPPVCGG
jgi:molybdopterin synthase sulfur carrier subunit